MRKRSFPPVINEDTRLLILGSLPGEQSLAAGRYYANPRNQFWLLVGETIGNNLEALSYEQRLETLLAHGIGLWDTVAEATRAGSLDASIRDPVANDLEALVAGLPHLRAAAFNGGRSSAIGMKLLARQAGRLALIPLPSSSPAHTLNIAEKRAAWSRLRQFIEMI